MIFKKKEETKRKVNKEPKNETYAGEVIKCPACHATVGSLMLECPLCHTQLHHEPNPAILEFSKQIEKFENVNRIISKTKRVLRLGGNNYSNLSSMKEVSYINEFAVPINQASFYEFMIYIRTKMEHILNNYDGSSYKWSNVWLNKAKEIREKASIVLPNDVFIEDKYAEITSIHKNIFKKHVFITALICLGFILLLGFIATMSILGALGYFDAMI